MQIILEFLKSIWRSEYNYFAWDSNGSCGGNTGYESHGVGWIHRYSGKRIWDAYHGDSAERYLYGPHSGWKRIGDSNRFVYVGDDNE